MTHTDQDFDPRRWRQWLQEIETHDADDPLWDQLAQLGQRLARLAHAKLDDRQARREALGQSLKTLVELCADALEYFGFDECVAWTADGCAGWEVSEKAGQVEDFRRLLDGYYVTLSHPPASIAEVRKVRAALEQAEAQLVRKYGELSEAFAAAPSRPTEALSARSPLSVVSGRHAAVGDDASRQNEPAEELFRLPAAASLNNNESTAGEMPRLSARNAQTTSPTVRAQIPTMSHQAHGGTATVETLDETTAPIAAISTNEPEPSAAAAVAFDEAATDGLEWDSELERLLLQHDEFAAAETIETYGLFDDQFDASGRAGVLKFEQPRAAAQYQPASDAAAHPHAAAESYGVPSPRDAAAALLRDETEGRWHNFVWSLIAGDDVPGAYWITRSLAENGLPPAAPEWLLRAVEGGRLVLCDGDALAGELARIAGYQQPSNDAAASLLGLAASLRPALVCPMAGMSKWLARPTEMPELNAVIEAVREFAESGVALRPEDLLGADGQAQRDAIISNVAGAIKRLDETASLQLREASEVWLRLVAADGDLLFLLQTVYEDRRDRAAELRRRLAAWEDAETMNQRFHAARTEAAGRNAKPLSNNLRERLARTIEQIRALAGEWCDHIEHAREAALRHALVRQHVERLQAQTGAHLPAALAAVELLEGVSTPVPTAAAAHCLRRALWQLHETLTPPPTAVATPVDAKRDSGPPSETLDAALARRLQWVYEVKLDEQGHPEAASLPLIAGALRDAAARGGKRQRRAARQNIA